MQKYVYLNFSFIGILEKKNSLTKIPQGVRGVRSGQTGVGVGPIHNYSFFSSALMCIAIRQSTV